MDLEFQDLKGIPLFDNLTEVELASISRIIKEENYRNGEYIFRENDQGESFYVIKDGEVQIRKLIDAETGRDKLLATFGGGDFFGEISLYTGSPRTASAVCSKDTTIYRISKTDFQSMLESDAHLASALSYSIIKILSGRLYATSRELVALYETGKITGAVTNIDELGRQILHQVRVTLAAEIGLFTLYNELSGQIEIIAAEGYKDNLMMQMRRFNPGEGLIGRIYETGEFTRILNPKKEEIDFVLDETIDNIRTLVCVPIQLSRGKIIGVILLGDSSENAFTKSECNLLVAVANQTAPAIENAWHIMEAKARKQHARVFISPV